MKKGGNLNRVDAITCAKKNDTREEIFGNFPSIEPIMDRSI